MRRWAQAALGLAVSALALWLTLRGKDVGAVVAAARAADYRWLAPYAVIMLAAHLVRALRWRLLLSPIARVPFPRVLAASAVGLMALLVLPLRLGEVARPALVADGERLRMPAALSSIVVERIVDGLSVAALLVAALVGVPDGGAVRAARAAGWAVAGGFAAAAGALFLAHRYRAAASRLSRSLAAGVLPRFAARVADVLEGFLGALRAVSSGGRLAPVLLLTAVFWGLFALAIAVLALGFGFRLSPAAAAVVLGVAVVGMMVPSGPGMVGTSQAATVIGLSLVAPSALVESQGVAFANVLWAAQLGFQVTLGCAFLASRHVSIARALRGGRAT